MTSPFTPVFNNPDHVKLLEKYLKDRGLEPSDFPEGLVPIANPKVLVEKGFNASMAAGRPFLFLQYLDPYGNPYFDPEDTAKANPHRVARFLGTHDSTWEGKPPPKVISPNGRPNVLHFEPIQEGPDGARSWHTLKDGDIVVHVESMVKARSVSKHTGFPTIGYNGVNSYSSSKRGVELIHTQYDVDFTRLRHVILFDSNVTKPEVAQARLGLMFKLRHVLGCKDVRYVDLPKIDGEDTGPDDFIVKKGFEPLFDLISEATDYKGEEHDDLIAQMRERAIYCTKTSSIIDRKDKVVRNEQKAASFYAPVNKKVLKGKSVVTVSGFNLWRESKERREVLNPGYVYLGPEFIERDDGEYYNVYQTSGPWPQLRAVVSEESDTISGGELSAEHAAGRAAGLLPLEPFKLVIRQLENMMSPKDLSLFRSYLKFLKFTGKKTTSFPVLFSEQRGAGKGWATKMAYRLIGTANSTSASARQFVSNFNAQLGNKRLVIVNEFKVRGAADKEAALNSLKNFLGDELITIEPKGVDSYSLENYAGMVITCNALEDVPTDGLEDRRMFYIDCTNKTSLERSDWIRLHEALDDPLVMEEIFWWVRDAENVDFSNWQPPMDAARERAILASSSSVEAACRVVLHDLHDDEENRWVCVSYELVVELLKREGVPAVDNMAAKTLTTIMKQMGWVVSERRYGKAGVQKKVWIVSNEAFAAIELEGTKVNSEVNRAAQYFVGHSKY